MTLRILLATRNDKKLDELQRMLGEQFEVIGLDSVAEYAEEPEIGATFSDNAAAKAAQAATATGEISLADDSGLAVDALNGMPGVLSARWSGVHRDDEANNRLLLAQIADVPDERRGAEFVCALALCVPEQSPMVEHGRWRGTIVREPRGSNGFGYDPIFVPEGMEVTSAELEPEVKDEHSHRGRAIVAILPRLHNLLAAQEQGP